MFFELIFLQVKVQLFTQLNKYAVFAGFGSAWVNKHSFCSLFSWKIFFEQWLPCHYLQRLMWSSFKADCLIRRCLFLGCGTRMHMLRLSDCQYCRYAGSFCNDEQERRYISANCAVWNEMYSREWYHLELHRRVGKNIVSAFYWLPNYINS